MYSKVIEGLAALRSGCKCEPGGNSRTHLSSVFTGSARVGTRAAHFKNRDRYAGSVTPCVQAADGSSHDRLGGRDRTISETAGKTKMCHRIPACKRGVIASYLGRPVVDNLCPDGRRDDLSPSRGGISSVLAPHTLNILHVQFLLATICSATKKLRDHLVDLCHRGGVF